MRLMFQNECPPPTFSFPQTPDMEVLVGETAFSREGMAAETLRLNLELQCSRKLQITTDNHDQSALVLQPLTLSWIPAPFKSSFLSSKSWISRSFSF